MLRRLLNIASIVCLVACVALMGMWVRSHYQHDEVRGRFTGGQCLYVHSVQGRLILSVNPPFATTLGEWSAAIYFGPDKQQSVVNIPLLSHGIPGSLGFGYYFDKFNWLVAVPFWFLVFASGALAIFFRLSWPLRFTLRRMFVVTTFLAVVLGMIGWLDRAWIGK